MTETIICPDCGGVVGGDPSGDVQVCKCFSSKKNLAGYQPEESPEVASARIQAEKAEKICRVCKKNLSGHRRFRTSAGYMCVKCKEEEDNALVAGKISCGECGKYLKPEGLIDYHGVKICKKCYQDHQEVSKFKAPPPDLSGHAKAEKQSLKKLMIIAGVLLLIFLLASLGVLSNW